jgi:hypothetical protein
VIELLYTDDAEYNVTASDAGMAVIAESRGCNTAAGAFTVDEIAFAPDRALRPQRSAGRSAATPARPPSAATGPSTARPPDHLPGPGLLLADVEDCTLAKRRDHSHPSTLSIVGTDMQDTFARSLRCPLDAGLAKRLHVLGRQRPGHDNREDPPALHETPSTQELGQLRSSWVYLHRLVVLGQVNLKPDGRASGLIDTPAMRKRSDNWQPTPTCPFDRRMRNRSTLESGPGVANLHPHRPTSRAHRHAHRRAFAAAMVHRIRDQLADHQLGVAQTGLTHEMQRAVE